MISSLKVRPSAGFFKGNRSRLIDALKSKVGCVKNSFVLFKGADEHYIYDDDQTYVFMPDNNVWWASGVDQPHVYLLISLESADWTVYIKKVPDSAKYWERIMEADEYKTLYEVDHSKFIDDLEKDLTEGASNGTLYILGDKHKNPYSGKGPNTPHFDFFRSIVVNDSVLYPTVNELRVRKTEEEIALLREAARIGSEGHIFLLQNAKSGMNEHHLQTLFRFYVNSSDSKARCPYEEIVAKGVNATVLHYHHNNATINEGEMVLVDAGVKLNNYCSDITSTFPINGKFSEKQKAIYEIVLRSFDTVRENAKSGVHWQDLQILAEKSILEGLLSLGLIKGGTVDELWAHRISYYFLPHGIGHYIGTYVHDLPGDPAKEFVGKQIPLQNIRIKRILETGMVVTNEPGLYFITNLLNKAKNCNKVKDFFDFDKIAEYEKEIQGVRIEEMLSINENSSESLVHIPRTVEQIERWMAKQEWK